MPQQDSFSSEDQIRQERDTKKMTDDEIKAAMEKIYRKHETVSVDGKVEEKKVEKPVEKQMVEEKPKLNIKPASKPTRFTVSPSPHIKDKNSIQSIMWMVVLALLPVTLTGIYFFKLKALITVLLAVGAAVAAEYVIQKLSKKDITINDGSAVLTGLLLALVLSPMVPWWIPVVGSIFAISIGKAAFGGLGNNIFNPALAGRAFLVLSWPALMTTWLLPDGITGATPLGILKETGAYAGSYLDLFLGNIGGCIGETSAIALILGAAFLFYKKIIDWRIPTAYIGTALIMALVSGQDPIFHISTGGLLIGAFFMATDYVTTPITKNGRLIFGLGCGLLTMIIRLWGGYPEGVMFSILLMNAATPLIDRFTKPKQFGEK